MKTVLAKRIQELRKKKNLSQPELAKALGLSMSAVRSYENSMREPNSKAMAALENYFNVSGAYLRGEEPYKINIEIGDNTNFHSMHPEHLTQTLSALTDTMINATPDIMNGTNIVISEFRKMQNLMNKEFSALSPEGQAEMLKRMKEYRELEDLKNDKK